MQTNVGTDVLNIIIMRIEECDTTVRCVNACKKLGIKTTQELKEAFEEKKVIVGMKLSDSVVLEGFMIAPPSYLSKRAFEEMLYLVDQEKAANCEYCIAVGSKTCCNPDFC